MSFLDSLSEAPLSSPDNEHRVSFLLDMEFFFRARHQRVRCSGPLSTGISDKIHPGLGPVSFHGFIEQNLFIITANHDLLAITILDVHNILVTENYQQDMHCFPKAMGVSFVWQD